VIRVLIVDDDLEVLDGLELQLRPLRDRWSVATASSGAAAIALLDREPFDAVVADLRMPEVDGVAVLAHARSKSPATVRLILSGAVTPTTIARGQDVAHLVLGKPCSPEALRAAVERTLEAVQRVESPQTRAIVTGLKRLPAPPRIYQRMIALRNDPRTGVEQVAKVIAEDAALGARVLALANSAAFGRGGGQIVRLDVAVARAGIEAVTALVLAGEVSRELAIVGEKLLDEVNQHGLAASRIADRLAPTAQHDLAFTAALLADVGRLVIAAGRPEVPAQIKAAVARDGVPLDVAERALLGTGHAEIGAYLLALWGLPTQLVGAVANHHHAPPAVGALDASGAVYVACALAEGRREEALAAMSPAEQARHAALLGPRAA
jgi:HD-like signal output (HDOD) protein/CheY-like chemotaxis protein